MNHEAVQEQLSSYLDGELSAEERAAVEEHLAGCAACREELELLRATLDALHDLPVLPAPGGFADAVLGRIPEGGGEQAAEPGAGVVPLRRRGPGVLVWAPVAMAAAAVLVVGIVWWQLPRLTGKRAFEVDQAAPTKVAERLEESEAAPAGATASGRYDGRERDKSGAPVASEPAAMGDELDGLADAPMEEGERADRGAAVRQGQGDGAAADGFGVSSRLERGVAANEDAPADESRVAAAQEAPAVDTITTEGQRSPYYAEWERAGGAESTGGDAVADRNYDGRGDDGFAPAPDRAGGVALGGADGDDGVVDLASPGSAPSTGARGGLTAVEKGDEFGFGQGETVASREETRRREQERLRKEAEAYRQLAEAEDDAMVDTAEELQAEEEARWAGESFDEAPVAMDYEAEEVAEASSAAGGGFKKGGATRSRDSREDRGGDRDRRKAKDRGPGQSKTEARAPAADDADHDAATGAAVVEQTVAPAPPAEASPAGRAEWTLQTTDAAAAYAVSELCDEVFSLRCTWGAPGYRPQSLGAQDNYQVVELHLLGAEYAAVQTKLRKHGSVLVRSEDMAMAEASDPIVVRLIIEYMP